jgi:2',3'-cyclic-nucleotide 2'-phosphodiesterase (5'-nucleotidase family)
MMMANAIKISFAIIALILFDACRTPISLSEKQHALIPFDTAVAEYSTEIESLIQPYRDQFQDAMSAIVGYTDKAMVKSRPEGALGQLVAEMVYSEATSLQSDLAFALLNHGGLRTPLPKGAISQQVVYELMPFDNEMVVLGISSEQMDILAEVVKRKGGDPIYFRQGGYLEFSSNESKFRLGNDMEPNELVYIATSDYLANGGDGYAILQSAKIRINSGILIRDIILNSFKKNSSESTPYPFEQQRFIKINSDQD